MVRVTSSDSQSSNQEAIAEAVTALRAGGVIACPTEAVWGLSCDPFNQAAVERVLTLKGRSRDQGLVLIAASVAQIEALLGDLSTEQRNTVLDTWPGPVTWVVPGRASVPRWITGTHPGVALRVTAHPIASALCEAFGGPLVSTSANRTSGVAAQTEADLRANFPAGIDVIVPGTTGDNSAPTQIRDALSGEILRASP
ncbi:MAG: tRNA threonylcarbamoyladenosine biosynthesis protein RimN [Gammaproteobacteria bacterium]|nr:MAG: tRNA threonylcarbamoyladenosine biosynthesis protein RimN [Gammaproteobacteria bacterium]